MITIGLFITAFLIGLRMGVVHERTRQQEEARQRQQVWDLFKAHGEDRVVIHTRADFERRQQQDGQPTPESWKENKGDDEAS